MDEDIKKYSDTLYETARTEAHQARGGERSGAVRQRTLSPSGALGLSGSQVQALVKTYVNTIERCMEARLASYKQAYTEAARCPSEQDFNDILIECQATRKADVARSTQAMVRAIHPSASGSPFTPEYLEKMIESGSAQGHDLVLGKWKTWKAKTQLKPAPAKVAEREKQCDGLVPTYGQAEFEHDLPDFTLHGSDARPCSLVVLDLDEFKSINDSLGHPAGNRVLKTCAELLLQACDGKGTVYRNGGDEFCVLLPNHSLEEAAAVAERILREARAAKTEELPNGLRVSIGVASFPESDGVHTELFSRADAAMYVSKKAGGNQVSRACCAQPKPEGSMSTLEVWKRLGE